MEKAKSTLEDILQIQTDITGDIDMLDNIDGVDYKIIEYYGISKHSNKFDQNKLYFNEYNYYLFAKFTELNQESASLILDETTFAPNSAPYLGLILFNKKREYLETLDISKFTQEYLNNLMLHHFIRLLGFNEYLADVYVYAQYLPKEDNIIYLDKDNSLNSFTNTIDYAIAYFGCSEINKINLYIDEENTDTLSLLGEDEAPLQTNRLYLPKPIFSGEILTKFDYSEEPVLSGFTLAFLDDLPYLKVKKAYIGDLTKFGKYAGCSPK